MLQEGKVRAKLAKLLASYDDVRYERSVATTKGIKEVCGEALQIIKTWHNYFSTLKMCIKPFIISSSKYFW